MYNSVGDFKSDQILEESVNRLCPLKDFFKI